MRHRRFPWVPAVAAGACLALIGLFVTDRAAGPDSSLDTDDRDDASRPAVSVASPDAPTVDDSPPPLPFVEQGHAGTIRDRRRAAARNAEEALPHLRSTGVAPWREGSLATEDDVPDLIRDLRKRQDYEAFLRILYRAPSALTVLRGAFDEVTDPIARQNLIFHLAITLPPAAAWAFLDRVREDGDEADREDALCAAAFRGQPGAVDAFLALATTPSSARVHRTLRHAGDHDMLVRDGDREALRSYRSIEVLDASPYFHRHGLGFHDAGAEFPWAHPERGDVTARTLLLLPAWRERYPGHSGSDDMAYRLSTMHSDAGDPVAALHWASRAATEPDQDTASAAVTRMVTLMEFSPEGTGVLANHLDPVDPSRNAILLQYIRLRRVAADHGFRAAVREVPWVAGTLPGSVLQRAWDGRWSVPASEALNSGLRPLPTNDPLRHLDRPRIAGTTLVNPACLYASWTRWENEDGSDRLDPWLHPDRERVNLPAERLARQFRAWCTLAELERRAETATTAERADLLYKRAAIFFHEPLVLYPVYARRASYRSGLPEPWSLGGGDEVRRTARSWMKRTFSRERAADLFGELHRGHPTWAGADKALYSRGLVHLHSLDDPTILWWTADREDEDLQARQHARRGVEALERLTTEWPASPLRNDAAGAARWWRTNRPRWWD